MTTAFPSPVPAAESAKVVHDLPRWNRMAAATFGDIEVQALAAGFCGLLQRRDWSPLRMVTVHSTPAQVHGGSARSRGWFLLVNRGGRCLLRQAGRTLAFDGGEMTLLRADEPYGIELQQTNRMAIVGLPLLDAPAALDERVARRHGGGGTGVVDALLTWLERMDDDEAAAVDAPALRRAVVDLVLLAAPDGAGAGPGSGPCAVPPSLLARAQAVVESHLDDPDLGTAAIGQALGVSARRVQLLFASQGTTPGAYVQAQRLERAARLLRERPDRITDIALQVGFGDVSHFCRAFQRRYGCTASRWRAGR